MHCIRLTIVTYMYEVIMKKLEPFWDLKISKISILHKYPANTLQAVCYLLQQVWLVELHASSWLIYIILWINKASLAL